ncbi:hypothetical protein IFM89_025300 [Coptis chinensis]|uniref:Mechanosensitive ion channel MscS domain-containing protein n=1 Tax=Coptis chinensis TaxID=261450 RepID=A0A835LCK8_9MAGN|nr:hypothetical protein IFM89_025300 [Coptis chinensis]
MRFIRSYTCSYYKNLTNHIPTLRANQRYPTSFSATLSNITTAHINGYDRKEVEKNGLLKSLRFGAIGYPSCVYGVSSYRAYSTFFGGKGDGSVVKALNVSSSDTNGSDGVDSLKKVWGTIVDAADYTGQKAKEASDVISPHVQHMLDANPYLKNVVMPVGLTLTSTLLVWLVMPRVLRKFHKYSMQGPAALLSGNLSQEQNPYEKSFWGAMEDPVRYLVTFMAFSQIGMMIAPTTVASQYIGQTWRGAVIIAFVWFLHRWKTNVFSRALSTQSIVALDREKMLALDKLSSVGLFTLGLMALAEACGVAVQSILTVGGIGGVATAFAARDILGNVLSGLSMQFSKPFSLGDTIKAGSIEGQVVEMGLTTTSLLNAEKFPVIVPNSLFSSQLPLQNYASQSSTPSPNLTESSAFVSSSAGRGVFRGGRGGRSTRGERTGGRGDRKCDHCGGTNHTEPYCWIKWGKPEYVHQVSDAQQPTQPPISSRHVPSNSDTRDALTTQLSELVQTLKNVAPHSSPLIATLVNS